MARLRAASSVPRRRRVKLFLEQLERRELLTGGTNQAFVENVYHDLLGREGEQAGVQDWLGQLEAGLSHEGMVLGFEQSQEYEGRVVNGLYRSLLKRDADPVGFATFLNVLESGGSEAAVREGILGSSEYYSVRGGGTDSGFLAAVYQDALGRPITSVEQNTWAPVFGAGGSAAVADMVLNSQEGLQFVVNGYYQRFLGRPGESGGLQSWLSALTSGSTTEQVLAGITGSEEYFEHHTQVTSSDTTPPILTVGSPLNNSLVNGDVTVTGTATDADSSVASLTVSLDGGTPTNVPIQSGGQFSKLISLPHDGSADGVHKIHLVATDPAGNVATRDVSFTLDTIPPSLSLLSPSATGSQTGSVPVSGTLTDSGSGLASAQVILDSGAPVPLTVGADGHFSQPLATTILSAGPHQLEVDALDRAGNKLTKQLTFTVANDFLVGPAGSTGFGIKTAGSLTFQEGNSLFVQTTVPVTLGGNRTESFQVQPSFDHVKSTPSGERFLVYLTDPTNSSKTLLDSGIAGSPIFALSDQGPAQFPAGLVQFDGTTVTIDVSSLGSLTSGQLLFQLLNTEGDTGGSVQVSTPVSTPLASAPNSAGSFAVAAAGQPGPAIDLTPLQAAGKLTVLMDGVQFDATANTYAANVRLRNDGTTTVSSAAVVLTGLPSGISVTNQSGTDASGNPYLNFKAALPQGGLAPGATSDPVRLTLNDAGETQFSLSPSMLAAVAQPPVLTPIPPLTVHPGGHLDTVLQASDPDGDSVTFSLRNVASLPTNMLAGNVLTFTPTPAQIGTYTFTVVASDGNLETTQDVSLSVTADADTTTRLSGVVRDAKGNPLANVPIEQGADTTTTAADGTFTLAMPDTPTAGVIRIRGDKLSPGGLPLLAEDDGTLLGHAIFKSVNNVIGQPFVLPALDTAHGTTIDPTKTTTVTTPAVPGLSVQVSAGTLKNPDSSNFTGALTLTAVPVAEAPANVPPTLRPDQFYIVDPGTLTFTAPAPINLPNPSGYAAGTVLDLFLLNPTTGLFEDVGTLQTSADGKSLTTVSGGLTHTGWVFPALRPPTQPSADLAPASNPRNEAMTGPEDSILRSGFGETDLHSGNVVMTHNLVPYFSLGTSHSLQLTYNSNQADPRPIVHFGFDSVPADPTLRLVANLTIQQGNMSFLAPGVAGGQLGLETGDNIWAVPAAGGSVSVALQADMRNLPSGKYDYVVNEGLDHFDGTSFSGASVAESGSFISINSLGSPFGPGWELKGVEQIVQNPDGSALIIDGDGTDLLFGAPTTPGGSYVAPKGEFSTLTKNPDGSFTWVTKAATTFSFDIGGRLVQTVDRDQNTTTFTYDSAGRLTQITDPVGLKTTLAVDANGRIGSITDPAGRVTTLSYDGNGNLIRITDPDQILRTFRYDAAHHIIQDVDKTGEVQSMTYDFAGRAETATRADGTIVQFQPLQKVGLLPPNATVLPLTPPVAGGQQNSRSDGGRQRQYDQRCPGSKRPGGANHGRPRRAGPDLSQRSKSDGAHHHGPQFSDRLSV